MKEDLEEKETLMLQAKDRAQKVVAALFLITNHLETNNPIRAEIRHNATLLLKAILSGSKIEEYKKTLNSFLSVGLLTKEFSNQNVEIIEREITSLKVPSAQFSDSVLSSIFVHDQEMVLSEAKDTNLLSGTTEGQQEERPQVTSQTNFKETDYLKDTYSKPKSVEVLNSALKKYQDNASVLNKKDEKKARRLHVLDLLSKTELRTIRDISKHFTDCSEKTIQRELNDLVDEKFIIRVGDRRWSTYKLK